MTKAKAQQARQHKWSVEDGEEACTYCGGLREYEEDEPCEEEDLSMWCAPGESVSEMLHRQASKD